jgi:hypothetical protein
MLTLHRKRRIAGTVVRDTNPHARHYRACNADTFDDPLATARGCVNGAVIGLAIWALLGVVGWAIWLLGA